MAKYKSIRVKMKGGKSRMQRVKVLASGKYRFVKNIGRRVTRRSKSRASRPKTKRGGKIRMAKRRRYFRRGRRGGGGKSPMRSMFKLLRLVSLVAPAGYIATKDMSSTQKVRWGLNWYTGFDIETGAFSAHELKRGWGPFILTSLATYGIPKLTGLIRRL